MLDEVEVWKDIPEYEGRYKISNYGSVISVGGNEKSYFRKSKKKSLIKTKGGYWSVSFCVDLKRRIFDVHRIVAKLFVPNPDNKPFVNHKDGNKLNNRANNLEWCTQQENIIHAYENGLMFAPKGENHGMSKLTVSDILEMDIRYFIHFERMVDIAIKYKVKLSTINKILRIRSWKHVERNPLIVREFRSNYKEGRLHLFGDKSITHKLSEENIVQIKEMVKDKKVKNLTIARMFNIHRGYVWAIANSKTWKHVA